ncbi:TIGR02450 family Trp-rich protein [Thalassotalea sp. LPB0316]|uniref:TIGR02450 family Trp-rich protein n=1 Tax=Thalassotalea sp. LPB0316 TaxID=2769490 RepID=UPI0018695166|nr:TIGR02450 family Trp-rich protein [Thalassotalea sp. LPB0316]QOL25135.1 TIGR02450 family Trp-rich protein [Thalassotalea sp. LPB0316]
MNQVHPKKLLHSKWTKQQVVNKEKHFMITEVTFDDMQNVETCIIEAIKTKNSYAINWRNLKDATMWRIGWQ